MVNEAKMDNKSRLNMVNFSVIQLNIKIKSNFELKKFSKILKIYINIILLILHYLPDR